MLLQRDFPGHAELLDRQSAEEHRRHQDRGLGKVRQGEDRQQLGRTEGDTEQQGAAGLPVRCEYGTEQRARGLGGEHQTPGGASDGVVGDGGAEDLDARGDHGVDDQELQHDDPDPAAGGELRPAVAQLPQGLRRGRAGRCRRDAKTGEAERRGGEGGRVHRQSPPRADAGDQEPAHRGADDHRGGHAHPGQRVGLAQ